MAQAAATGWAASAISSSRSQADPDVLFDLGAGLTPATNFFFQVVFAATAVTIASGAMAERTKFTTYLVFAAVMTAIIYPVVVHWTWGGGLIAQMSIGDAVYSDFAGSTIVHLTGGVAALVGAYLIGPRIGKYGEDGKPRAIPGHNVGYAVIGVFILWFGWFGFNAGSELAADEFVPFLAMNTLIAAAAGVIGATAIIWFKTGVADVAMAGQRGACRPCVDHCPSGHRHPSLRPSHRTRRRRDRGLLGPRLRQDQDRRSGGRHFGARHLRHLGHALDWPLRQVRRCVPRP
jgi:ammonia channel protein AmtB